jgi:hypothetical protein
MSRRSFSVEDGAAEIHIRSRRFARSAGMRERPVQALM